MSAHYKDFICEFVSFLQIQDETTLMYQTGMELIKLCKMTQSMANIEQEAEKLQLELEAEGLMEEN